MSGRLEHSRRQWLRACGVGAIALRAPGLGAQERVPVAPVAGKANAFRRVTLEVSLKPFHDISEPELRRTCEEIFSSWAPLLRHCDASAIMLWAADGSEILDYSGKMEDAFDWARYLGDANPPSPPPANDPNRQGTHGRHWLYIVGHCTGKGSARIALQPVGSAGRVDILDVVRRHRRGWRGRSGSGRLAESGNRGQCKNRRQ